MADDLEIPGLSGKYKKYEPYIIGGALLLLVLFLLRSGGGGGIDYTGIAKENAAIEDSYYQAASSTAASRASAQAASAAANAQVREAAVAANAQKYGAQLAETLGLAQVKGQTNIATIQAGEAEKVALYAQQSEEYQINAEQAAANTQSNNSLFGSIFGGLFSFLGLSSLASGGGLAALGTGALAL